MADTDALAPVLCESCKKADSVTTLRHRKLCRYASIIPVVLLLRPCVSKLIIQKFRRQIGALSAFFETQKKKTKGRLDRILVICDSSAASEALLRMLDSYYTKDDTQDQYLESRLPYINVFEITAPVVPYPSR